MICQNCGENNANIKYTQSINGIKKEITVCEKCAQELGIGNFEFNMPINFSSFLGDFFENYQTTSMLENFNKIENQKCKSCGETYNEFIKTGLFGCPDCYNIFSEKIDDILKKLQGSNRHIGRKTINYKENNVKEKEDIKQVKIEDEREQKIDELQKLLKKAIQEENYEEAAKLRDEIKLILDKKSKGEN